jgi:phosphoribosylaminoimidazole-succinocarboxamide synthase
MRSGLVDGHRHPVELGTKTPLLDVHRVQVLKPSFENGEYNYTVYQTKPTQALVPLEIIFRFGVPKGSSLMKRVGDANYLAELGLFFCSKLR